MNWHECPRYLLSIHKGTFCTLMQVGDGTRGSWTDEHMALHLEVSVCCRSCDQTRWANVTLNFLRQTACFSLLAVSWTCYWKNHFGMAVAVVRGAPYKASQMIYAFDIYNKDSIPHWKISRLTSLSNFELNPADLKGCLASKTWVLLLNTIEGHRW